MALNLGSLVYNSNQIVPWLNGDIIAVSSLFPKPHVEGHFKITLSKAAYYLIQTVQNSLIKSCCEQKMNDRLMGQQFITTIMSDFSPYLQDYFTACSTDRELSEHFSLDEITKIKQNGLDSFSKEQRALIIERMANLKRKTVEEEYGNSKKAYKYSNVLKNVQNGEHEKLLMNYMKAIEMSNIKEKIKQLTGVYVFGRPLIGSIIKDHWEMYSIYAHQLVQSAFRTANTVKFNTPNLENQKRLKKNKQADLSFTFFGMANVLQRSQDLKVTQEKELALSQSIS